MKFVCDACGARYHIEDKKVRGKILRIRCKQCAYVITVREPTSPTPATVSGPPASVGSEEIEWFYSVNGVNNGPLSEDELLARYETGELGDESYVWQADFDDWRPAVDIPVFGSAIARAIAARPVGGRATVQLSAVDYSLLRHDSIALPAIKADIPALATDIGGGDTTTVGLERGAAPSADVAVGAADEMVGAEPVAAPTVAPEETGEAAGGPEGAATADALPPDAISAPPDAISAPEAEQAAETAGGEPAVGPADPTMPLDRLEALRRDLRSRREGHRRPTGALLPLDAPVPAPTAAAPTAAAPTSPDAGTTDEPTDQARAAAGVPETAAATIPADVEVPPIAPEPALLATPPQLPAAAAASPAIPTTLAPPPALPVAEVAPTLDLASSAPALAAVAPAPPVPLPSLSPSVTLSSSLGGAVDETPSASLVFQVQQARNKSRRVLFGALLIVMICAAVAWWFSTRPEPAPVVAAAPAAPAEPLTVAPTVAAAARAAADRDAAFARAHRLVLEATDGALDALPPPPTVASADDGAPTEQPTRRSRRHRETEDDSAATSAPASSSGTPTRRTMLGVGTIDPSAGGGGRSGGGPPPELFAEGLRTFVNNSIVRCNQRHIAEEGALATPRIELTITVQPSGRVSAVTLPRGLRDTAFGRCMQSHRERWLFPAFTGSATTLTKTYVLQ